MRWHHVWTLGAALVLFPQAPGRAERRPLSRAEKEAEASHIVAGVVQGVYSREVQTSLYGRGTVETHYLVDLEVGSVAKGQVLKPGQRVYAHCWRLKKHGALGVVPGPSGHFGIPAAGDRVRVYLKGEAGKALRVVSPNGFDALPRPKK
jgi:hypothetical protein